VIFLKHKYRINDKHKIREDKAWFL